MPGKTVDGSAYTDYPTLSSDQQQLLLNALQSNERLVPNMSDLRNNSQSPRADRIFKTVSNGQSVGQGVDPNALEKSTTPNGFVSFRRPTFGDSFLPDFTNGRQTDFDVDLPQDVSEVLSGFGGGYGEKRSHSDDSDDDDDNDPKRGEGDERTPKKPGRKLVTAEPTTKRKAQNRAAQRAFRERKEQHLKDLEGKINDLQSASAHANHENSLLKAQVLRLQSEVKDYRKRVSSSGGVGGGSPMQKGFSQHQNPTIQSSNPFDFSFGSNASFENFASLPVQDNIPIQTPSRSQSDPFSNDLKRESTSRSNSHGNAPNNAGGSSLNSGLDSNYTNISGDLFAPGFFNVNAGNSYGFPQFGSPGPLQNTNSPHQSRDASRSLSEQAPSLSSHGTSPPSSSASQNGPSSSCGTSPEPSNGTYSDKQQQQASNVQPFSDLSSFQFNPDTSLFGDYREPQTNILGDGDFSGGLYDDWFNIANDASFDFGALNKTPAPAPVSTKPDLMAEVAKAREAADNDLFDLVPKEKGEKREMMTCHKIWKQLQTCPKFQQGDIDIDGLCGELQKKATCTESGATISKDEWENALWRIAGVQKKDQQGKPVQ